MKTIQIALITLGFLGAPVWVQATIPSPQTPGQVQRTQTTFQQPIQSPGLSKANLRDVDRLVVQLSNYSKALHDQQHTFLEGQRHAVKLDQDVTALERMADGVHSFATQADGSQQSVLRMRQDTNSLLQLSFRIARTIELTQPWLRGNQAQAGIKQMRSTAGIVTQIALKIDSYLPVDPQVIDGQTEILEAAIKELHDEFHEHLDGYEVSRQLDEDIEEIETLVEHMHEMAHNQSWASLNLQHLFKDLNQIKQKTAHIESLFVRQAGIGVRTQDWIGIEHSRDAISDVLSSAYLLEHMIRKTAPAPRHQVVNPNHIDTRPLRDRHGHPINPRRIHDRHVDQLFGHK